MLVDMLSWNLKVCNDSSYFSCRRRKSGLHQFHILRNMRIKRFRLNRIRPARRSTRGNTRFLKTNQF